MEIYSLIPAATVLILAIITHKTLEPLIMGCVAGYILLALSNIQQQAFPDNLIHSLKHVIAINPDTGLIWVILVCVLYGSFIQLIIGSGGINAIGTLSQKFVKTKKQALIMTYWTSFIFFLDDYLGALAVGNTMRKITDSFSIPRIKLAYIISLVCVPLTVIIPLSTWAIFLGVQLVEANITQTKNPILAFLYTIPYNFSAWISLFLGLLVVYGLVPNISKSTHAPNPTKINTKDSLTQDHEDYMCSKGSIYHFTLPLLILIIFSIFPLGSWKSFSFSTIHEHIDMLRGVTIAVSFTYIFNWATGAMTLDQVSMNLIKGIETIVFVLAVLTMSYLLKDIQEKLGFNTLIESTLRTVISKSFLPVITFMFVGFIGFATGSNWGMYIILVPIITSLANLVGANIWLTQGALVSATVWGSAAGFFSDNRVLIAQSTEVSMTSHAISQLTPQLIIYSLSALLYLIFGLI